MMRPTDLHLDWMEGMLALWRTNEISTTRNFPYLLRMEVHSNGRLPIVVVATLLVGRFLLPFAWHCNVTRLQV